MKFNTYIYYIILFIAEESAPTTPTTPKPVPIGLQQQQRDVDHRSSGVSHQEVYNNSSVVNGYTNINKKASSNCYKGTLSHFIFTESTTFLPSY